MITLLGEIAPTAAFIVAAGIVVAWVWHELGELDSYGCDCWTEDDL